MEPALIREVKYISQSKIKRYSNWANRLLVEIALYSSGIPHKSYSTYPLLPYGS